MKVFRERGAVSPSKTTTTDTPKSSFISDSSEPGSTDTKFSKPSLWSSFLASAFSVFDIYRDSSSTSHSEGLHIRHRNGWTSSVKKILAGGTMRRIQERVLGTSKTGISNTTSDIWFLGACYKISQGDSSGNADATDALAAFHRDFSSRILITYRKGFDMIEDSKFTSDVNWGCMLRSSQMLVAQALLFHRLGRSWRKPLDKPLDQDYVEILHLFGDSEASAFSIRNLLQAGKAYGLAAGSWVGPYAMCRSWESLARSKREETNLEFQTLPMAVYVVSGCEDGERGGAPVLSIEDAARHCSEFSKGREDWTPILLLVPLVLGLDKINPRYIPSLQATFTFPQSLGILGGKPGASTYIVGVQDKNAFYLDPHEVQPVVNFSRDDVEANTSSYHCDVVRHIPLDLIDPSLAIGFYCRDKDDFDDFCSLASKLADESNGAPLFTVANSYKSSKHDSSEVRDDDPLGVMTMNDAEGCLNEDGWQLL
ncbi:PREDICTED: cysteine protease ATG4-like [Populus euphratica]|uniref:Cysteine protease n=1 Tax=Populus euphratica TaxID=75702 RepID=A0AAJ6T5Z0_POPEU|nr:PREDICTED: cysteine protease ATG4-like [Populus euphratica]